MHRFSSVSLVALVLSSCAVYSPFGKDDIKVAETALACVQVAAESDDDFFGPEDIEAEVVDGKDRIYISASRRRGGYPRSGAIFIYDPAGETQPSPMVIKGLPEGGFAPHGISLFRTGGVTLLFAINHGAAKADTRDHVEIFRVENDHLVWVERIPDTEGTVRRHEGLNDLVAVGPKSFYATMTGSAVQQSVAALFGASSGSVIYFGEGGYKADAAGGGLAFPNGIVARIAEGQNSTVYVATSGTGSVLTYREMAPGTLKKVEAGEISLRTSLDNLNRDGDGALLVGAHPNMLRFVAHAIAGRWRSPSQVLRIPLDRNGLPDRSGIAELYGNDGMGISASSVGTAVRGNLFIGQVFEPFILRCNLG